MKQNLIAFNTGRHYTKHMQRITVALIGNHAVFMDHDRAIEGVVYIPRPDQFETGVEFARWVMQNYDHNQYVGVLYGSVGNEERKALDLMRQHGYDLWCRHSNDVQVVPTSYL